jgi:hypothetical protein
MVKEGHNYNVPKISCLLLQLKVDALAAVLCSPTKNNFPPTVKSYTYNDNCFAETKIGFAVGKKIGEQL